MTNLIIEIGIIILLSSIGYKIPVYEQKVACKNNNNFETNPHGDTVKKGVDSVGLDKLLNKDWRFKGED